jgi:hypothetical protein
MSQAHTPICRRRLRKCPNRLACRSLGLSRRAGRARWAAPVPVVGVLASALALGEPLTAAKLVGLGLIGAGVAVLAIACAGAAKPAG